jgi:uncharacterized membrane protein YesL
MTPEDGGDGAAGRRRRQGRGGAAGSGGTPPARAAVPLQEPRRRDTGRIPEPEPPQASGAAEPAPGGRGGVGQRPSLGEALHAVFTGVVQEGWRNLMELVLLSVIWFVFMLSVGVGLLAPTAVQKGGGLLLGLIMLLLPIALVGPACVGLFHAVDAIWSGDSTTIWDALRHFFGGFRRRYLRSVGLSALWFLVALATFANLVEDRHLVPTVMLLGVDIVLFYLLLFIVMVNVYLISILATTDFSLFEAIRLAAWHAVANPIFTLAMVFAPGVVVAVALGVHALFPVLVGAALAMFSTAALRHAPLRHPDLPPPVTLGPLPEDG